MENKEETILKASEKVMEKDREVFIKFMNKRFSTVGGGYANEWAERFKTGHPEAYMDSLSTKVFEGVKNE